jgi:hypothetical protein
MAYHYVPEKAWIHIVEKASDDEVPKIAGHPGCPGVAIDKILLNESWYSDDAFIAALSTDHAIKKLREAGFNTLKAYNVLYYNRQPPSGLDAGSMKSVFERIIRISHGPLRNKLNIILQRAVNT